MGGEFLSADMMQQRIAHQVEQLWWEVEATRYKKAKRKAMARFPRGLRKGSRRRVYLL